MSERYQLIQTEVRLELRDSLDSQIGAVYVDFVEGKAQHRLKFGGGKGQDIAKAVGLNKYKHLSVVDATAGLGREAFVLASLGCQVTLLERSATVYALLADGLKRAAFEPSVADITQRMHLIQTDAMGWLQHLDATAKPDVIYLDPMFPERQKSALVQKEMRFLQAVVGDDADNESLLDLACTKAHKRIVVKRPRLAPELAGKKPAFVISGAAVRYDVYLPSV